MKEEVTSLLIKQFVFIITYFGSLVAIVAALRDYNKRRIEECREKSVGAEAIVILRREIDELKKRQEKGELNEENVKTIITRLERDYDALTRRLLDFFRPVAK